MKLNQNLSGSPFKGFKLPFNFTNKSWMMTEQNQEESDSNGSTYSIGEENFPSLKSKYPANIRIYISIWWIFTHEYLFIVNDLSSPLTSFNNVS